MSTDTDRVSLRVGALRWTTVAGLLAVVVVVERLVSSGAADWPTGVSLAAVFVAWVAFVGASAGWQRAARAPELVPPAHLRLRVHGAERLPAGEAEVLVDAASPRPPSWLGAGTTTLISLGLAGTFLGLTLGLFNAVPLLLEKQTDAAIQALLAGAQLAFVKSLLGIVLGTLWSFRLIGLHGVEARLRAAALASLQARFPPISPDQLLALSLDAASARHLELQAQLAGIEQAAAARHAGLMQAIAALPQGEAVLERLGEVADAVEEAGNGVGQRVDEGAARAAQATAAAARELGQKVDLLVREDSAQERQVALVGAVSAGASAVTAAVELSGETVGRAVEQGAVHVRQGAEEAAQGLAEVVHPVLLDIATGASSVDAMLRDREEEGLIRTLVDQLKDALGPVIAEKLKQPLSDLKGVLDGFGTKGAEAASTELTRGVQSSIDKVNQQLGEVAATLGSIAGRLESAASDAKEAASHLKPVPKDLKEAAEAISASTSDAAAIRNSFGDAKEAAGKIATSIGGAAGSATGLEAALTAATQGLRTAARELGQSSGDGEEQDSKGLAATMRELAKTLGELGQNIQTQSDSAIGDSVQALTKATQALTDLLPEVQEVSQQVVIDRQHIVKAADEVHQKLSGATAPLERFLTATAGAAQDIAAAGTSARAALTEGASDAANTLKRGAGEGADAFRDAGTAIQSSAGGASDALRGARDGLVDAAAKLGDAGNAVGAVMEKESRVLKGAATSFEAAGTSASEQVAALRTQLDALRVLHNQLQQAWVVDYKRLVEAHEKVSQSWQAASTAADQGRQATTTAIVNTALQLKQAVGLGEDLSDLKDAIEALTAQLKATGPRAGAPSSFPYGT